MDTNINVSAFEFGGGPMRLLQVGLDGKVEVAVSQPIIDDDARVEDQIVNVEASRRLYRPVQIRFFKLFTLASIGSFRFAGSGKRRHFAKAL